MTDHTLDEKIEALTVESRFMSPDQLAAAIKALVLKEVESFAENIVAQTLRHPDPRPSRSWIRLAIDAALTQYREGR